MTKKTEETAYRFAIGFTLFTWLRLIWVNIAVGIIGSEENPVNLMYFGVFAVGIIGAVIGRFQAQIMAGTMLAMALAQTLTTIIALTAGLN